MRIYLTELLLDRLDAEKRRTGLAANALLAIAPDVPPGLNPNIISSWFRRTVKTAELDLYLFTMSAYARLQRPMPNMKRPLDNADDRLRITAVMRETMRAVHDTVPSGVIFGEGAPPGLTPVLLCRLTRKRSSGQRRNKTIQRDIWEYLSDLKIRRNCETLLRWKLAPNLIREDIKPPRKRTPTTWVPSYAGVEYTPISDDLYRHFHAEISRTLVSPRRLLEAQNDCPKGLTHLMIANWLSGATQSAERRYLDYVYFHYGLLPDAP